MLPYIRQGRAEKTAAPTVVQSRFESCCGFWREIQFRKFWPKWLVRLGFCFLALPNHI